MTKIESKVEPYGVANDIWWEPVTFVSIHSRIIYFRELICQYHKDIGQDSHGNLVTFR